MRTSRGPGSGTGRSSNASTSGPPCSRMTTARNSAPQVDPDALRLEVAFDRIHPEIPTEPALLESAERQRRVVEVVRVHPDGPRADRGRDLVRLRDVPGPDPGGQAVDRAVRL